MKVQFTDPEEFLDEVRRDTGLIDRGIVRVTVRRRVHHPFVALSVVATAAVGPTVVALEHRVGEALGGDPDPDLSARVGARVDALTRELAGLGLDVRAGVLEPTAGG